MDIAGWLRGRGLGQYEPVFRDNEIDSAVLPSLTAEDLKDLGIGIASDFENLAETLVTFVTLASILAGDQAAC
jgi:hypothetical protein